MRLLSRLSILLLLVFALSACNQINYSNFYEGITHFRAQEYRDAFIRLKPQAEKGQPDAEYAVGYMYYYGQGVVEDREKAWYWITKAAREGQPDAIEAAALLARPKTKAQRRPASLN